MNDVHCTQDRRLLQLSDRVATPRTDDVVFVGSHRGRPPIIARLPREAMRRYMSEAVDVIDAALWAVYPSFLRHRIPHKCPQTALVPRSQIERTSRRAMQMAGGAGLKKDGHVHEQTSSPSPGNSNCNAETRTCDTFTEHNAGTTRCAHKIRASAFEHVPGFYLILLDTRLSKIQEHFRQVKSSRSLFWIPLGLVWILLGAP